MVTSVFFDIGGVLLSNGWDHLARQRAAMHFELHYADLEERHKVTDDILELGKITLDTYLKRVIFYEDRPFTMAQFQTFMFEQSSPDSDMLRLATHLKVRHSLRMTVVSNEGRELNDYRIQKFNLGRFIDSFVCSCFVHVRKPDEEIFRIALDVSHSNIDQVVYIENSALFVQIAEGMGIRSIHHTDYGSTRKKLAELGLGDGS